MSEMQRRNFNIKNFKKREDENGDLWLEGYFAVFGSVYELWPGATESILPGAFKDFLATNPDVRALYNHNHDIVLGRTTNGTLILFEDDHGLFGRIKINREDSDAMNAYNRILRGDVTQCSFGFDIAEQNTEYREDGSVHWTLVKINPLYEVSPCVFAAYEETTVSARKKDFADIQKLKAEAKTAAWRQKMREKLLKG